MTSQQTAPVDPSQGTDLAPHEGVPGHTSWAARTVACMVYAFILTVVVLSHGVPSDTMQVVLWLWGAAIIWNVRAPLSHHLRFARDWSLPVLLLILYFYSRGIITLLDLPVHVQMPITVDRWLGGGEVPTAALQRTLCGDPCDPTSPPAWFDVVFTFVYVTHFLFGLTLALVLWMRNRSAWVSWMRCYVGINLAALVIYFVYPMAPPWLASETGALGTEVFRITPRGWGEHMGTYHALLVGGVSNPTAAMPSLHAGIAFLLAGYGILKLRQPWRWALLLYPLTMSFALVYFAEHYVIDIVAGALLALAVLRVNAWWEARKEPITLPSGDRPA